MAEVNVADPNLDCDSDVDDLSVRSFSTGHSEPYDWKNEAQEILTFIFRAAVQRSSPNVDLQFLTSVIRNIISRALVGVEERVLHYADHVTLAANQKREEEQAKFLLEMEQSVKSYFEERLRTASHMSEEEIPPFHSDGKNAMR